MLRGEVPAQGAECVCSRGVPSWLLTLSLSCLTVGKGAAHSLEMCDCNHGGIAHTCHSRAQRTDAAGRPGFRRGALPSPSSPPPRTLHTWGAVQVDLPPTTGQGCGGHVCARPLHVASLHVTAVSLCRTQAPSPGFPAHPRQLGSTRHRWGADSGVWGTFPGF